MIPADLPLSAWAALRPAIPPPDGAALAPNVWRLGDEVLKRFPQSDLARFRRIVRAHRQAGRIFRGCKGLAAQRLLGFDENHRALLLGFVPGRSGRQALEWVAPEAILAGAGAWLRVFHAGRETGEGRLDPLGALARLPRRLVCAEAEGYSAALGALHREAEQLQGRRVRRACLHGDMTLANLVFHAGGVTGIDFENLRRHPAERDIGELWADLLLHVPGLPSAAGLMPETWESAFALAYPALTPEVAAFYTRHRLLKVWAAIPPDPSRRGPRRDRQLRNLGALRARGGLG
ncbi:hypothetical protein [Marinovum sp.]|uniref:hypothetical protein n=1 Tax=Marinovum sp. TaxID=2024839 RepID=UPI002B268D41|nr:hypothetical protein [Marinovum sp.]